MLSKSKKKYIIIAAIAVVILAIIIALICTMPLIKMEIYTGKYTLSEYTDGSHGDRIHFLNTGGSDAILLESKGKYALVDSGEDNDNPRNFEGLKLQGYEDRVLEYVKKIAGDANGKVTLEFIIGTHSHSDHIGGFDTLVLDNDITVNKAYIRQYNESVIDDYEIEEWDNKEVYNQFIAACNTREVPVIHDLVGVEETFGNFTVSILNGEPDNSGVKKGENEYSLGVLVEGLGKRAFLAGDINNLDGDEDRLGDLIGKINLLKPGHHGYHGSTSKKFVEKLKPEIAVLTNTKKGIDGTVRRNLNKYKVSIHATVENNGVIVEFSEKEIKLFNKIH